MGHELPERSLVPKLVFDVRETLAMLGERLIDEELWCIDGTTVRAARCATGGGKKGIHRNLATMR